MGAQLRCPAFRHLRPGAAKAGGRVEALRDWTQIRSYTHSWNRQLLLLGLTVSLGERRLFGPGELHSEGEQGENAGEEERRITVGPFRGWLAPKMGRGPCPS